MEKIKVLHIIKTLNLGGAETNLFNLVNALDYKKYEVHVAYSYGGEIESRFRRNGVTLFKYADQSHKIKSWATLRIVFRLVRYILKNRIRIIHTHVFNAHVWGLIAAKLTGRRIVEHVHDFRYMESSEFRKRYGVNRQYRYAKYLRNQSDAVIVLTKETVRYLEGRHLYLPDRIREVHNGIPLRNSDYENEMVQEAIRQELNIRKETFVIFTAARLSPEKNIGLIFRIAQKVAHETSGVLFLVSGNGELLENYRSQCRELGLERFVRFIGFYPDTNRLLAISHLFLLPSFLELHSISLLEAMSMKVPVIVSRDVGCHGEFLRNWKNGVLLDPFSDEKWDRAILKLIHKPKLRKMIGESGWRTCKERFEISVTSKKIEGIYAELATSPN